MIPSSFVKQPWEWRNLIFDLSDAMATGDTIDSIDSVTVWYGTEDKTADMLHGTPAVDTARTKASAIIKGGTTGYSYWVRIRVITAAGDKIEDDLKLLVKALGG
jgi:hypothetical protein